MPEVSQVLTTTVKIRKIIYKYTYLRTLVFIGTENIFNLYIIVVSKIFTGRNFHESLDLGLFAFLFSRMATERKVLSFIVKTSF